MSELAAAVANVAVSPGPGKPCSVAAALAQMSAAARSDFDAWGRGELKLGTDAVVAAALRNLGHRVGEATVGRHRRGLDPDYVGDDKCRCYR